MPPDKGCIYTVFFPCPAAFTAIAQHGSTDGLAALARHRRVRLRVEKRKGLYFLLRPLLRRKGLWTGLVAWGLVLVWLQGLIWAVDYGSLTTGQRARAGAVLRSCGLAARHCRNRGAAALRRVCPAGKRRVLLGKPEF